jgi:hypothetical protein
MTSWSQGNSFTDAPGLTPLIAEFPLKPIKTKNNI